MLVQELFYRTACEALFYVAAGFAVKNPYQIPLNLPCAKRGFLRKAAPFRLWKRGREEFASPGLSRHWLMPI
jgi:hypothetical protein